jgi:hypothetical protein
MISDEAGEHTGHHPAEATATHLTATSAAQRSDLFMATFV